MKQFLFFLNREDSKLTSFSFHVHSEMWIWTEYDVKPLTLSRSLTLSLKRKCALFWWNGKPVTLDRFLTLRNRYNRYMGGITILFFLLLRGCLSLRAVDVRGIWGLEQFLMKFGRVVIGMIALFRPTKIGAYGLLDKVKVRDILRLKWMDRQALMKHLMDYSLPVIVWSWYKNIWSMPSIHIVDLNSILSQVHKHAGG